MSTSSRSRRNAETGGLHYLTVCIKWDQQEFYLLDSHHSDYRRFFSRCLAISSICNSVTGHPFEARKSKFYVVTCMKQPNDCALCSFNFVKSILRSDEKLFDPDYDSLAEREVLRQMILDGRTSTKTRALGNLTTLKALTTNFNFENLDFQTNPMSEKNFFKVLSKK